MLEETILDLGDLIFPLEKEQFVVQHMCPMNDIDLSLLRLQKEGCCEERFHSKCMPSWMGWH